MAVYAERKISAFIQDRLGPMEVGPYGMAQTLADLLKLIQKEDLVPEKAKNTLFKMAPFIIFIAVFTGYSILPITPNWPGAGLHTGIYFFLAIVSLDVLGIFLAGWSSNNKYSLLGSFRAVAQKISYEIPLTLSILSVCLVCQSLDLKEISFQQGLQGPPSYALGIPLDFLETTTWGGIFQWNVFKMPLLLLVWVVFFIASLAESNRTPFDLPEAESELVAGFQTEYSGFRWALIMLAEYGMMFLVSILGAILFFGSWNTPFPNIGWLEMGRWTSGIPGSFMGGFWALFWLLMKTLAFVGIQMWVRWTFPRLRVDQLMELCWKYLTPFALVLLLGCGLWKVGMFYGVN